MSPAIARLATAFATDRPTLVTGPVGDLVFLRGEAIPFREAVTRLGATAFDTVLTMNAVDPLAIVHGADAFERARRAAGLETDVATPRPGAARPDGWPSHGLEGQSDRMVAVRRPPGPPADPIDAIRALLHQDAVRILVVIDQADILLQDPAIHDVFDRVRVGSLQLALRHQPAPARGSSSLVLLAGSFTAVPRVLTEHGAMFHIELPLPNRNERLTLLDQRLEDASLPDRPLDGATRAAVIDDLADLTDGCQLLTLLDLFAFSARTGITVRDPRDLVERFRTGARSDHWSHLAARVQTDAMPFFSSRLFGQPAAIEQVVGALAGVALGATTSGRQHGREGQPKGLLMFVGPTGVGKTELAKLIAEFTFGDPEAYARIDMSALGEAQDAARLLGAAPGYVGYEQGGELTNAVLRQPAIVILLDEIEKAHPAVFDRILSIIEDGRVSDAQGRVAYFGEAIIIATSNVGGPELLALLQANPEASYDEVREHSMAHLEAHFTALRRPEVYGRLKPGIVAFDFLRADAIEQIANSLLDKVRFEFGPDLHFDRPSTLAYLTLRMEDPRARALGGRQIRNEVRHLLERVASSVTLGGYAGADVIDVSVVDGELELVVEGRSVDLADRTAHGRT